MFSRGASFVLVLIAFALVGGAVAVSNIQAPITNNQENLGAAVISARDKSTLADIERQLNMAGKTGGISPASYKDIDKNLKKLEAKKIDTKRARELLSKLEVGGTKKKSEKNTTSSRGLGTSPELKGGGEKTVASSGPVTWEYYPDEDIWRPSRTPPSCGKLEFKSPVDLSKVDAILYPGQIRGKSIADYKAHGGFILKESTEVRVPFDGTIFQGARFLQNGVMQYGFDIVSECGIMMRFGHLFALPPKFQALAAKMRPAVEMDSHTTDLRPFAVRVSKGELLATKVGTPEQTGMDWGLHDIRHINKSAEHPEYRKAHKFQGRYDNYALCWLDYLPVDEQRIAKALPGGDGKMGKRSDYCTTSDIVIPAVSNSVAPSVHAQATNDFAAVRGEIEDAERRNGRFSEEHSARLLRDLAVLEKAGVAKSELERLRAIVYKQSPHLADIARKEEEAKKAAAVNTLCADSPPVLTADITDFSKIRKITAPGTASSEGPKGHSFIWTDAKRVPVYAPTAGVYDSGSYSKDHPTPESKAQYLLFFRVKGSCGYQFKFDHIDEPVASIRSQFPSEPKISDSRGTPATTPVEFKAGEIIGYTTGTPEAGNWDFGLYNMNKQGALKAHGCNHTHCNSVCWPDFYAANKKTAYRRLLEGTELVCSLSTSTSEMNNSAGNAMMPQVAPSATETKSSEEPPVKLKGIGIELADFDPATGRAGDVVFTKEKLQFNVPFTEFGFVIPASMSASGANKSNPQPTFQLPLGTKVHSLVDGIVVEMPMLYSGDYSVMVAPSQNSNWRYETEHVINPLVKVGDKVTAGQVIAEVSPHNKEGNSGFGLVEIGILNGGNPPRHLCPFAYLDPSIKDNIQKKFRALYKSWEEYRGDSTLYNEEAQAAVPGCLTLQPIEG